jgi:hypothetical protein
MEWNEVDPVKRTAGNAPAARSDNGFNLLDVELEQIAARGRQAGAGVAPPGNGPHRVTRSVIPALNSPGGGCI